MAPGDGSDPDATTEVDGDSAGRASRLPVEFRGTARFEVVRTIGAGGMGVVFEAEDKERGTRVALKTLRDASPDALLRFKEEFRSHANVYHEHLVRLGELVESDDQWFFTMELVEGQHFLSWIGRALVGDDAERGPALTAVGERRLRLGLGQLASALRALHAAHRVHRDIKSANVLVTAEDRLVIVDFGVVGDISRGAKADGAVLGTPSSMAPEQAAGAPASPAADWYAVGVLLYQALTGRRPFSGPSDPRLREPALAPVPPHLLAAGVPPDLEALCLALLRRDPAERAGGEDCLRCASASEAPGVLAPAIFVGRSAELDALRSAYAEAMAGEPVAVSLEGESGIGKSELARRFTEEVAGGRAVVLRGRCYERESVPYKAVDGIVDALARHLGDLDPREVAALLAPGARLLAQTFPVLNRMAAIAALRGLPVAPRAAPRATADPRTLRADMFTAFRELLHGLARRGPLVVLIDDVHWADGDSIELLGELMQRPGAPPLLLLLVSRGAGALALRVPGVRRLEVGPLPAQDADQLIDRLAGVRAADVDRTRIERETGGHPLFIDELVRHRLQQTDAAAASLEDVLWQRIARLDDGSRRLLALLAVAGQPAPRAVLAAAHAAALDGFDRSVARLLGDRLARALGAATADVYHDRIRGAVLGHLGADEQRGLHRSLAQAYDDAGDGDPEILATQWHAAGELARATDHTIRAARRAAAALAFGRAARLAEAALALLPGDAPAARAMRVELGDALAHDGQSLRAAEVYLDAARASEPPEALELQRRAVEQYLRCGHVDEGLAAARSVLGAVGMAVPRARWRAILSTIWQRARLRVRGFAFELRDAAAAPGDHLARIDVAWTMALGLGIVDNIHAAAFQSRHLLLALAAGEPRRIARALAIESAFLGSFGAPMLPRARRVSQRALAVAEPLGDPHPVGLALGSAGIAACLAGEWREAQTLLDRAEAIMLACAGTDWELVSARVFRLTASKYLGDYAELAKITDYVRQAQARGDFYAEAMLVGRIGWMASLLGDQPEDAQRQTREALQRWSGVGSHTQHRYHLRASASIAMYTGDAALAYRTLAAGWRASQSSFFLRRVQMARIEMLDIRGRAALAAAAVTPAGRERRSLLRRARRDAVGLARERTGWATVLAALLRAGAAAVCAERDAALSQLAVAEELAGRTEMLGYRMIARRRYGELIGGTAGTPVVEAADAWLRARGVVRPDRLAALLAPGF